MTAWIDELVAEERAKFPPGDRWQGEEAAIDRIVAMGESVVPDLVAYIRGLSWEDEAQTWVYTCEDECARAIVAVGSQAGVDFLVECAEALVRAPAAEGDLAMKGVTAIDALARSSDPAVHRRLVEWALEIGPDAEGWSLTLVWHLLDAAAPYLDERALPMLEGLMRHRDIQDTVPAAKAAYRAVIERRG